MNIETIGIIGAGTMGSGIATNLAQHGLQVRLTDNDPASVDKAIKGARTFYDRAVEKSRMKAEDADAAVGRLHRASALADLAGCDLVIEAVFEDFDLKAGLFDELSSILDDDTLVATNTSCLRVSDLAAHMRHPGRFLGLHYFSPAQINPIVEVVRGKDTEAAAIDGALSFVAATGKRPLLCKDAYGFAINRFFCPYTNEAARLLDEGEASTSQIDAVARDAVGAAAGPFLVMNLIKPRINLHAIRNLAPLGAFYEPADAMIEHGEADKSFVIGEEKTIPPALRGIIADRLRLGAFLPVLQDLDEDIASPEDIDLGAEAALRFDKPPCALMDELGGEEVARILQPALDSWGIAQPASLRRVGSLRAG